MNESMIVRSKNAAKQHSLFDWRTSKHQEALQRFALAITVLTVVGHAYLGFEQSVAQPLIALATAYPMQIFLEWLYASSVGRTPRFRGGIRNLVNFLLPAHIGALAIAMLLYFNERLWVVAFAVAVSIGSKYLFRVPTAIGSRHIFNPSNLGITATLLLFPSVGIAMPWQWTTEVSGVVEWLFPVVIFILGTALHLKYADRIWVVLAFLVAFIVQALIRGCFPGTNIINALTPATGVAAAIFTFYMAPDPATSPSKPLNQMVYGASIAFIYMALMMLHVVFALFYSLTLVCLVRGIWIGAHTQFFANPKAEVGGRDNPFATSKAT